VTSAETRSVSELRRPILARGRAADPVEGHGGYARGAAAQLLSLATNDRKFVCYYRVSTGRQGKSGLGLDAQRAPVATYLNGGSWQIVDEFTEVESGKRPDRPALDKALARGAPAPCIARRQQGRPLNPFGRVPVAAARGRRRRPVRGSPPDRWCNRSIPASADGRGGRARGRHDLGTH